MRGMARACSDPRKFEMASTLCFNALMVSDMFITLG